MNPKTNTFNIEKIDGEWVLTQIHGVFTTRQQARDAKKLIMDASNPPPELSPSSTTTNGKLKLVVNTIWPESDKPYAVLYEEKGRWYADGLVLSNGVSQALNEKWRILGVTGPFEDGYDFPEGGYDSDTMQLTAAE